MKMFVFHQSLRLQELRWRLGLRHGPLTPQTTPQPNRLRHKAGSPENTFSVEARALL